MAGISFPHMAADQDPPDADAVWTARVAAAADTLEAIGADWRQLDRVPSAIRERLHQLV